jgi:hypothetical protein
MWRALLGPRVTVRCDVDYGGVAKATEVGICLTSLWPTFYTGHAEAKGPNTQQPSAPGGECSRKCAP